MAGILLRIRIPSVDTARTVKVSGTDTIGEVVKQITKRIPTIDNSDEYGLLLPAKNSEATSSGTWLEEDKKIDQYGLGDKVSILCLVTSDLIFNFFEKYLLSLRIR
jgi:hypothetical protein